jgi:hypothetical protein
VETAQREQLGATMCRSLALGTTEMTGWQASAVVENGRRPLQVWSSVLLLGEAVQSDAVVCKSVKREIFSCAVTVPASEGLMPMNRAEPLLC